MQEIERPKFKVSDVFQECIPVKRNKDLKERLKGVAGRIVAAEVAYEQKAKSLSFYEINPEEGVGKSVSTSEMCDLYDSVFARKASRVRGKFYDVLMLAPEDGTCPMCSQRDASTLDHYLPKAKNPRLAVTPINLVPACRECNTAKLEHHPESAVEQLFHPYYDKLPDGSWLVAEVDHTQPPALKFCVSPPEGWDENLVKRLVLHFKKLDLAKLYASQAGKTLSGIAGKLMSAADRGGKDEVRFLLLEDARSWSETNLNGWQAAMYKALAGSDWFCEEGYAYAGEKRKRKVE